MKAKKLKSLPELMGPSEVVRNIEAKVQQVASSDFTVIIFGETGSGKELIAQAIHQASPRKKGPFVAVDCGAIQETLVENELFGHEKGAFTGALQQKPGKFEEAKNGTLLLDEISNMTLGTQAKMLRALQEKTIYRVGGTKPFEVDVRVLVSCNQNLVEMNTEGSFRQDLYYRLNEFTIKVPALRERKEDIPYLANRFLKMTNNELEKTVTGISSSAMQVIMDYHWPGNVRQLKATIRRAVLLADEEIQEYHLGLVTTTEPPKTNFPHLENKPWHKYSLKEIIKQHTEVLEREVIQHVLEETQGNKAQAARVLQIDYKTLHNKLKQLRVN